MFVFGCVKVCLFINNIIKLCSFTPKIVLVHSSMFHSFDRNYPHLFTANQRRRATNLLTRCHSMYSSSFDRSYATPQLPSTLSSSSLVFMK